LLVKVILIVLGYLRNGLDYGEVGIVIRDLAV
jgi:hypothetical protein